MENVVPFKIQILAIFGSLLFMLMIARLIMKGKLREEYSIVWLCSTVVLMVFAFWRNGIELIASALGVYYAPAILFLFAIFAIIVFLVHISVVNSRQHREIKDLAQQVAFLKEELQKKVRQNG